ncbi:MAG: aminopeptidase [Anaerolineae bacterium]|nr:aminopeptidase [Anaerolineae bacterium]
MTLTFKEKLQNYADLAIEVGVGLQAGQRLIIRAPVDAAELVRLITATAYDAGARLVDVLWHDDAVTLARFQHAPRDSFEEFPRWRTEVLNQAAENGDAVLSLYSSNPNLLKDQDPELVAVVQRVTDQHMLPFRRKLMADKVNWSIIAFPVPSWAEAVFPDLPPAKQISALWEMIFKVCRADQIDPVEAWQEHNHTLKVQKNFLNLKQYAALQYKAPGTDLTIGLPEGHIWHGGSAKTVESDITFTPNIPTEEIFTLPHKDLVDGTVSSTRPLSYGGVLIDDFSLTFENGRVVNVTAGQGETVLKNLIDSDEGAARLGEIALVPNSSPISKSGLFFYNTLYDENASCHLALGRAYRFTLEGGNDMADEEFAVAGGNDSLTHVDFMIGSSQLDIDGITRNGAIHPIMRGGEWAF